MRPDRRAAGPLPRHPPLRAAVRLAAAGLRHPPALALAAALALGLGSAGLTAVASFSARLDAALSAGTAELMGGDVQVSATRDLRAEAAALPEELEPHAIAVELPTMAAAGERLTLVELKAVTAAYPLYGTLQVAGRNTAGTPPPGQVWVDGALLPKLGLAVGDTLELGERGFRIAGVIEREPDRLAGPFRLGPRVLMGMDELDGTGLVTPLSRVRTDLLYRDPAGTEALASRLRETLGAEAEINTAREGLETTRGLLAQAGDFLRLAGALSLLVALAAAAGVDALLAREARAVAVLRALGASRRTIAVALGGRLLLLGLAAGVLGALGGAGLAALAAHLLRDLLPAHLPPIGVAPLALGAGAALGLALAMGFPALRRLTALPPGSVLRESAAPDAGLRGAATGLGLGALVCAAMLLVLAERPGTTAAVLAALGALGAALLLAGRALARLLARPRRAPFAWRYASAAVARAPGHTALAVTALALAVLAGLAPALVAQDLLAHWQRRVPADAPNRFLIDVQAGQRAEVEEILAANRARDVELKPVVRARLTAVNGAPPRGDSPRARRLAQREQNLTTAAANDPRNRIVAGRFWSAAPEAPEVSVDAGFAAELGLALGDVLHFEAAGMALRARVTSLREVVWESLRSNFFLVLSPGTLNGLPTTYVTSFRVDPARGPALERALTAAHPNLTVLDLEAIKTSLAELVDRLAAGAGAVSAAAAFAGLAVLLAAVLAERTALTREAALLRALGAGRWRVRGLYALRFGVLGLLAGALGAGAAVLAGAVASAYFLDLPYRPSPGVLAAAVAVTALAAAAVGSLGARGVLAAPPMATLRAR